MARASWDAEFHPACESWTNGLGQADAEALVAAVRVLRAEGPSLGRPLVDTVKGSRYKNMKELRPGSTGRSGVRVLFAFDKERRAILLLGGDKSEDWDGWYKANVPMADDRFEEHQARIEEKMRVSAAGGSKARKGRRR
jgi:hypothetical protein